MASNTDSASESLRNLTGSLVLLTSQSGDIASLVDAPDELRELLADRDDGLTIDDLWPAELAAEVRDMLKRTVRDKRTQTNDLEDDATGHEVIYVPQGPDRVMMIVRDLSEQKLALSRARSLAYTDEATGLPNREFLFGELQRVTDVQRLKEGRAAVICLYVGQIDDHGYALNSSQQDDVLRQLAERLQSHLRGSNDETISDFERLSIVARSDYRHFCIVLPSIASGEDAEAVIVRVIEDLTKPVTLAQRTLAVKAYGGVSLFPQDANDPAGLFENALAAMEDARNDAATPYKFHSGTVRLRTLQRQDLEGELKSALEREMYALNFLPVVDTSTGETTLVEALLRWPDTIIGSQPTRRVIRVAERTGLIIPIGQWVIQHACEQLQVLRQAGHKDVRLSINLSSQELASDDIAERIARILEETNTDPRDLDIEIKEHMLFRESLRDYATCRALAALGVRISVDDYGIGACSLAQLAQSPVSAIKIDNTIVANVAANAQDSAACAATIAVANALGIDVIAEGVEREEQAEILSKHGCNYQQGFLYSRPMNDDELRDYLATDAGKRACPAI
jgi:EAL domain-containing protein (putative c-di-GMP-specific phosphodiesterase class I)/GGDEF domain-containing protein